MKQLWIVPGIVACLVICGVCVGADNGLGEEVALLRSGRAFVPLRAVFEWLDAEVLYANGKITATRGNDTVKLAIGRPAATKNDRTISLDVAPFVTGGKSFVPLRFVAEAFGATVNYNAQQLNVTVIYADRQATLLVFAYRAGWLPYMGAWFKIDYPVHFRPIGREQSSSGQGYDGASFVSPDGLVEFYVFSPQWQGESNWVKPKPGERESARSTERDGDRTATHVTLTGPDDAYERAYVEIKDDLSNTNWFFGIMYENQNAHDKYLPLYLEFKEGLVQYAD